MNRIVSLMYHGLYDSPAEREAIDAADRPYAISVEEFCRQLDALGEAGLEVVDPVVLERGTAPASPGVVLTFDDGHGSNYRHAFPILRAYGLTGVFFVTSDFIGARPGFCTWPQLREMTGGGQRVGSHGKTHRFFDDLSPVELVLELNSSRDAIGAGTGVVPTLLSFPGGRYRPGQVTAGLAAGYTQFFTSNFGSNRAQEFVPGALLRRIAVRQGMRLETFTRLARADARLLAQGRVYGAAKAALRRILGNRLYHALYESLSA